MFAIGFSTSYLFSLPIGVLNTSTAQISITDGLKKGAYFAVAAALVESVQVFIAFVLTRELQQIEVVERFIQLVAIGLFIYLSIYYWRKKPTNQLEKGSLKTVYSGVKLSMMNVMAIPFWVAYFKLINVNLVELSFQDLIFNISGIFAGTVLALMTYGLLGRVMKQRLFQYAIYFNKTISIIFLVSAFIILYQLF